MSPVRGRSSAPGRTRPVADGHRDGAACPASVWPRQPRCASVSSTARLSGPGLTQGGLSGLVAQLVERLVRNEEAEGSTPFRSTHGMRRDPSRRPGLRSRSNAWRKHHDDETGAPRVMARHLRPGSTVTSGGMRLCAPFTLRNIGYAVTVPCVRPTTSCGITKPRRAGGPWTECETVLDICVPIDRVTM